MGLQTATRSPEHVLAVLVLRLGGKVTLKADDLRQQTPEIALEYDEKADSYTYSVNATGVERSGEPATQP